MEGSRIRRHGSNLFVSIGYVSTVLQWLWLLLIIVPPLIESGFFNRFNTTLAPVETTPIDLNIPEPILWGLVTIVTIAIVVLTIIILVRLPGTIARGSETAVQQATKVVLPVLTHNKHVASQQQRQLTLRISFALQVTICLLPLILTLLLPAYKELTKEIIMIIAIWLFVTSLVCYVVGRLMKPKTPSNLTSRTR